MKADLNGYYDHAANTHTLDGAVAAWKYLSGVLKPRSVLDVGCGRGTWMRAIETDGILDVLGLDGVPPEKSQFLGDPKKFKHVDLGRAFNLQRRFDLVICLEVAEHIPEIAAAQFVGSLCLHADTIAFSAAAPSQGGQHHINCQWPRYWQQHFNRNEFACFDEIRPGVWEDPRIEPWYRQNIFVARRDPTVAGSEQRLASLVHPEMLQFMGNCESNIRSLRRSYDDGSEMSCRGYIRAAFRALMKR